MRAISGPADSQQGGEREENTHAERRDEKAQEDKEIRSSLSEQAGKGASAERSNSKRRIPKRQTERGALEAGTADDEAAPLEQRRHPPRCPERLRLRAWLPTLPMASEV